MRRFVDISRSLRNKPPNPRRTSQSRRLCAKEKQYNPHHHNMQSHHTRRNTAEYRISHTTPNRLRYQISWPDQAKTEPHLAGGTLSTRPQKLSPLSPPQLPRSCVRDCSVDVKAWIFLQIHGYLLRLSSASIPSCTAIGQ